VSDFQRLLLLGAGTIGISVLLFYFSGCSNFDFSNLKYGLTPSTEGGQKLSGAKEKKSEREKWVEIAENREQMDKEGRAKAYVETAIRDYYNGSYEEALKRLERAKLYDPSSYEALRLSGQILFEKSFYRKAFNDWSRATQIPNDDQKISRDIDVLKRLLRYSRNEMDRLQRTIYRHPQDRVAVEKLKELQAKMAE